VITDLTVHAFGAADAPPLVLVHGLTEAGTTWPDAVSRWSGRWRLLAVDQRGHGHSARFTRAELDHCADVLVDDLVALLEPLGVPIPVVGHSLGGWVAVQAASRRPDLVRALVLEDPALAVGSTPSDFAEQQERFLDGFAAGVDAEVARMRVDTAWTEAEIRGWAECKPLVDREMIRHLHLGSADPVGVLDALRVPTLIIAPRAGPLVPDPSLIGNPLVRIVHVAGVGHCVRRDDPDAYHALADPFLDRYGR
jgi:pimeloyl-ACP methyl ester carboxylesterase